MSRANSDTPSMALFCDFENVALGVEDAKYERFDIGLVLERLLLKGSIVVKKAYCDWARYRAFKPAMHQASFELIEIPHVRQSGKNSADIRLVVDALDLCYTKTHVDTFVIISGDSDFSPLVSKLRENDKTVIGVGVRNSTSDLLIANCDEFIFYDDLVKTLPPRPRTRRRAGAGAEQAATGVASTPPAGVPAEAQAGTEPIAAAAESAGARKPRSRARTKAATARDAAAPAAPAPPDAPAPPTGTQPDGESPVRQPAAKSGRGRGRKRSEAATPTPAAEPSGDTSAQEVLAAADDARPPEGDGEDATQAAIDLVMRTIVAIASERGDERVWGSMVKQTLKRQNPGFNERAFGYRSFNGLLEDAAARGHIELEHDGKSGGYILRLR